MKLVPKNLKNIADNLSSKTNFEWDEIESSLADETTCVFLKNTAITVTNSLTVDQIKAKIERYRMNLSQAGSFHVLRRGSGGLSINGSFGKCNYAPGSKSLRML